jgi:hypothetical protein
MEQPQYAMALFTGALIGSVHGIILWLSFESFRTASLILYGDIHTLAIWTTGAIDITILVPVLTSGWWLPALMRFQERYTINRGGNGK